MIQEVYQFHTGHVIQMVDDQGICRRTLYRWLKSGLMSAFKHMDGSWLFSLEEINRIRQLRNCEPLTKEEAYTFWKNN